MFGSVISVNAADLTGDELTLGKYKFNNVFYSSNSYEGNLSDVTQNSDLSYLTLCLTDATTIILTDKPLQVNSGNSLELTGSKFKIYVLWQDNSGKLYWNRYETGQIESYLNGFNYSKVKFTSYDLTNSSGYLYFDGDENFFLPPRPLAVEVGAMTEETLVGILPQMGGMMSTLALCGVGCLALLVGLRLFGKRSLIFRR